MRGRSGRALFPYAAWFGAAVWFLSTSSFAAETGNVCVRHFSPGNNCTGTGVAITQIVPVSIVEDCPSGDPTTAQAILEAWVSAGTTLYDIGLFVSLNGDSALDGGDCLHDYLEPPLEPNPVYGDSDGNGVPDLRGGPWWNGEPFVLADECGDIVGGTDSIKTLISLRFSCVDSDLDGIVDVSTCASWSAGEASTCPNLSAAAPGTSSRCACNIVETGVPMAAATVPAGRVTGLTVDPDAGGLHLAWGASCSGTDNDYEVYEGVVGNFTSHVPVLCSTGGATSATISPGAGDRYYLAVPRNAGREGSYGLDGALAERPPSTAACVAQDVQICP